MTLEELEANHVTTSQIAEECGVTVNTAHNWLKYHRHMESREVFGKPVVSRENFEKFKSEHPELVKQAA